MNLILDDLLHAVSSGKKLLTVLIDPDKFEDENAEEFLCKLPKKVTHLFVGGSTVVSGRTAEVVRSIKQHTKLPILLFPGDHSHITEEADAILFLSLISGRNPEYLIEQQVKSVDFLKLSSLEIIPTGYLLIDGGRECAVQKVSKTQPIPQTEVDTIVNTALAGQYSGKKLIYLEAGSGALHPVSEDIIQEVKAAINIPLIVGGGIRSSNRVESTFKSGADMVVVGTAFEKDQFEISTLKASEI